jgi:hypothetical protein
MNVIVERVAETMYTRSVRGRPAWAELREGDRAEYREKVQEVLLAVMHAGLIIRELSPQERAAGIDLVTQPSNHP